MSDMPEYISTETRDGVNMFQVWIESLNGVSGWAFSYPLDVLSAAACVKEEPTPMIEITAKHMAQEFRAMGYRATVSHFDP